MRLSLRAATIAVALLWGGGLLCAGLAHLANPSYGTAFLDVIASIYPGFHGGQSFLDVMAGTGYALIDGGLCGLILAWLYNLLAERTA